MAAAVLPTDRSGKATGIRPPIRQTMPTVPTQKLKMAIPPVAKGRSAEGVAEAVAVVGQLLEMKTQVANHPPVGENPAEAANLASSPNVDRRFIAVSIAFRPSVLRPMLNSVPQG